jgi:hypothetical protein
MQEMIKEVEAKLERMDALNSKDHRETEIFLQGLHSEITSMNLKIKPYVFSQAREQILAEVILENS